TSGAVHVRVSTSGGTSPAVAGDQFTYNVVTPTVTSINPTSGPTGGGTSVTITGTGFVTGSTVSFGAIAAPGVTVNSTTQITVPSPATLTPSTVDVTVTNSAGTSTTSLADEFTYNAVQPAVTALSPNNGPTGGGTVVTITGTSFINGATVSFGGTAATGVVVNSATSITAVSPATLTPGTVDVRVSTSGGTSPIVAGDHFTYNAVQPAVTSLSP